MAAILEGVHSGARMGSDILGLVGVLFGCAESSRKIDLLSEDTLSYYK